LDHPQSRNALSDAMLDDLIEAFTLSKADPDARVAVLTSSHPLRVLRRR